MKSNSSYIFLFTVFFIVSCTIPNAKEEKAPMISSNSLEGLLPDSILKTKSCKNILLIKKNDCLGCEQILVRFLQDTSVMNNTFIINETIRKIELQDYYTDRPYLTGKETIFDSNLLKKICKRQNIKFNTSILIVLDERNQIIEKNPLKIVVGNIEILNRICQY